MTVFRIKPDDKPTIVGTEADFGTAAEASLTIDGRKITYDISDIELYQYVDDHHLLRVRLRETGQAADDRDISDEIPYANFLGKSIALKITPKSEMIDSSRELNFIGLVTRVDIENSVDSINVGVIEASSPTITMDGARKNAFFTDMTASDLVGSTVRNHPITVGNMDSSSSNYKFVVQYQETDYEFVQRLAVNAGMFAFYDGQEFRLGKASSADTEELAWRKTLGSFSLGLGTKSAEVTSTVYNYQQAKTYSQSSTSLPQGAALSDLSQKSPDASKQIYSDPSFTFKPKQINDAQSLDETLKIERSRAMGAMIQCHGRSIVPAVASGHCIKITGMEKIDGTYFVVAVKHVIDAKGRYYNTFECTPLDIAAPPSKSVRPRVTNLQPAIVTDNEDPEKMGRVKVKFPWYDTETPWIRIVTPHAGNQTGLFCLPEIEDEVLVGYEMGSPDLPVALGGLYNGDKVPHDEAGGDKNSVKIFSTRSGHKIVLDDTDGSEKISIVAKDGTEIILDSAGPSISLTSDGDITIKGANITIESQQEIKMKAGTNLNQEGGANLKTKAGAMLDIEGAMVTVKGQPIQLN